MIMVFEEQPAYSSFILILFTISNGYDFYNVVK